MSSKYNPAEVEVGALEYWQEKYGKQQERRRQPSEGFSFISDKEAASILQSQAETLELGGHTIKYTTRLNYQDPLKGIVEGRADSGEVVPLIAEIAIEREPFLLRSVKKAFGIEPLAQYAVQTRNAEHNAEVAGVVSRYKERRIANIHDFPIDDQVFIARIAELDARCSESLVRWGVKPS